MDALKQRHPHLANNVPCDVLRRITSHIKHLDSRESIGVDRNAIEKRVIKYGKQKSKTSQHVSKIFKGMLDTLMCDGAIHWHRPLVSPFHTKTGRDTSLGASLNYIPKDYWPSILKPPDGYAYVLLDYQQQEPIIAAHLAGCQTLLDWYQDGDIYECICSAITGSTLTRNQAKKLLIAFLYGISVAKLAEQLQVTTTVVHGWFTELRRITEPIGKYLNDTAKEIRLSQAVTSLDWRHAVTAQDTNNSLRNWKIQAMGADIMRRACLGFDAAQIPLLLTNHDSFLVKLPVTKLDDEIKKSVQVLQCASTSVLGEIQLKIKVEMVLPTEYSYDYK
ncbi:DNA polymerase [Photobacterium damselae subsp. damselae]|uniref:DNA polymerase n=1 Tax=Photobacterium damselae TaxID=38293 RepID=UPI001EEDEF4F|nr:DNA polymerase [Photobacterium damselae]UJZ93539.1 DNA polymerase [Photobacterium damselae subsp. damselae]UJZ97521.1 DNA polymerase [Photobacterium damselae subsp. damselae]